jgi:hypothetical protein
MSACLRRPCPPPFCSSSFPFFPQYTSSLRFVRLLPFGPIMASRPFLEPSDLNPCPPIALIQGIGGWDIVRCYTSTQGSKLIETRVFAAGPPPTHARPFVGVNRGSFMSTLAVMPASMSTSVSSPLTDVQFTKGSYSSPSVTRTNIDQDLGRTQLGVNLGDDPATKVMDFTRSTFGDRQEPHPMQFPELTDSF